MLISEIIHVLKSIIFHLRIRIQAKLSIFYLYLNTVANSGEVPPENDAKNEKKKTKGKGKMETVVEKLE